MAFCGNCGTQMQDDVNFCPSCGKAAETAGTVSTGKSDKVNNLYTAARRARGDGNSGQAFKYYEQLQMEDPNNWESAFFVTYFTAINTLKNDQPGDSIQVVGSRVSLGGNYRSGLSPAISAITNCLDSVFDLIEDIQDDDEQIAAAKTVHSYVESMSRSLNETIDSEHARMQKEILEFGQQTETGHFEIVNYRNRDDSLAKSYKQAVLNMGSVADRRMQHINDAISTRRFAQYWAAHQDEKRALEAEKQSLQEQVSALNSSITEIPGYREMMDSQQQLQAEKSSALSSIPKPKTGLYTVGIVGTVVAALICLSITPILSVICILGTVFCFVLRSKALKPYKAHLLNVTAEFEKQNQLSTATYAHVTAQVEAMHADIASHEERIHAIDHELTRPR